MNAKAAKPTPKLPDDYPLFDVDNISLAFSTAGGKVDKGGMYLDYYSGQADLVPSEWSDKANRLFFKGGNLASIGLKPREGNDETRVRRALHYLLSSWEPKHEEKEATVGFALMKWCEPLGDGSPHVLTEKS